MTVSEVGSSGRETRSDKNLKKKLKLKSIKALSSFGILVPHIKKLMMLVNEKVSRLSIMSQLFLATLQASLSFFQEKQRPLALSLEI